MKNHLWKCLTAILVGVALGMAPAAGLAVVVFDNSCQGQESQGGGAYDYQYELRNFSTNTVNLDQFYVGTMDVNPANYTNVVMPGGWSMHVGTWAQLGPVAMTPLSLMFTTGVKTPHGQIPPQQGGFQTPGAVLFVSNGNTLSWAGPGPGFTFGFDNPKPSWDMEWLAEDVPRAWTGQGLLNFPISGPSPGNWTQGWVHGPGVIPEPSSALLLLSGFGVLWWARRRRYR
jgi:hypothetical protein